MIYVSPRPDSSHPFKRVADGATVGVTELVRHVEEEEGIAHNDRKEPSVTERIERV